MEKSSWGEAYDKGNRSLGPPWPNGSGLDESIGLNESGPLVSCAEGLIGPDEKWKPSGREEGCEGVCGPKSSHSVDESKEALGGLEDAMVWHNLEGVRETDKGEEVGKCDGDKLSDLGFILEKEDDKVDNVLAVGMSCGEINSVNPGVKKLARGQLLVEVEACYALLRAAIGQITRGDNAGSVSGRLSNGGDVSSLPNEAGLV
ncbi:hypothetical protein GUJ93_ZPchr0001g31450 [Zizania palustris]|uniref:Uncharacterized protein n=1 Tax=Zizania palustris TaxID=103762 RepID=A0A8J5RZY6_ZIZPA|nr:hypothetical protein GUJ93_ZPchr0001g31450 [Zizania palustris]